MYRLQRFPALRRFWLISKDWVKCVHQCNYHYYSYYHHLQWPQPSWRALPVLFHVGEVCLGQGRLVFSSSSGFVCVLRVFIWASYIALYPVCVYPHKACLFCSVRMFSSVWLWNELFLTWLCADLCNDWPPGLIIIIIIITVFVWR